MSHKTCFYVTADKADDGEHFNEQDLFDINGAKFDYCHDLEADERAERIGEFFEQMEAIGATVDREARSVTLTPDAIQRYFAGRYDELRAAVAKLTPEDFACDTGDAWKLQQLIEDEFDDGIYENGGWRTLDSYMRHCMYDARCGGATFFVRNAVDIHY